MAKSTVSKGSGKGGNRMTSKAAARIQRAAAKGGGKVAKGSFAARSESSGQEIAVSPDFRAWTRQCPARQG